MTSMKEKMQQRTSWNIYGVDVDKLEFEQKVVVHNVVAENLLVLKKPTKGMRAALQSSFENNATLESPKSSCWDASVGYKIMIEAAENGK